MRGKKVTVIIPFISLNKYVLECIDACLGQKWPDFTLVLLPDKPIQLPEKYNYNRLYKGAKRPKYHNPKIKVIATGEVTISKKRNIGIQKFPESDFFAFIDSDAYPHPNWLKYAIKSFSISCKIIAVGGPNISPKNESIYERVVGNALKSFLVSGAGSFRKKITSGKSYINLHLPTCNLIVKNSRDFLVKFDEGLFTGEDIDLCNRIINRGWKIFYHNNVVVYHHNRPLFRPFVSQRIIYGFSLFRVLKKKIYPASLLPAVPLLFLLFLIFGFFATIFNPIIRTVWLGAITVYLLTLLIETIRYSSKIYEIPLTFIAIFIGNLAPAVGSFLEFLGIDLDIGKMYRNYYAKNN